MRRLQPETGEEGGTPQTSWFQLGLELGVFCGIAVLLVLAARRIPAARVDAMVLLAISVVLHAAGLVRLAIRAADHAERDPAG